MQSKIKRWGNSAAVRLPAKVLAAARLDVSSPISMVVKGRKIIIEALQEPQAKRLKLPFNEAMLLADLNPETAHCDELALPSAKEVGD